MTSTGIMASSVHIVAAAGTDILFEPFNNFTDAAWVVGTASINASGRTGTCALLPTGAGSVAYHLSTPNKSDVLTIGFAWRTDTIGVQAPIFELRSDSAGTRHGQLVAESTNGFTWRRGALGTTLTTSATGLIVANTWYYLEVQCKLHDTTGAVTVRRDGVEIMAGTALDTKNGGTETVFGSLYLYNVTGPSPNYRYDDLYLTRDAGVAFKGSITLT